MKSRFFILPLLFFPLFFTGCGAAISTISSVASIASSYVALRDYIGETAQEDTQQPPQQPAPTTKAPTQQPKKFQTATTPPATYPMASNRYLYGPNVSSTTQTNASLQSYFAYPVE